MRLPVLGYSDLEGVAGDDTALGVGATASTHGLEDDRLVDHARNGDLSVGIEGRIDRVDQPD